MTHAIDDMASRRRSIGTWTATQRAKAMFFAAAGLSMVLSIYLFFLEDPIRGVFVGLWVPSILAAGALLMARGADHD